MILIQTYYKIPGYIETKSDVKTNLKFALLSSFLAKKHFNDVILYTSNEDKELFKNFIPYYTGYNTSVLEKNKENFINNPEYYAIPKLFTYKHNSQKFIHIDLDTFLFNCPYELLKPEIEHNNGVFIGHFDFYFSPDFKLTEFIPYENYYREIINNCYKNKIWGAEILDNISLSKTINANIFGGFNQKLISDTYEIILNNFIENKEFYNNQKYTSLFLEQMMFYPVAKSIFPDLLIKEYSPKSIYFNYNIVGNTITFNSSNGAINNISFELNDTESIKNYLIKEKFGGTFHYGNFKHFEMFKDILFEYMSTHDEIGDHYNKIEKEFEL